MDATIYRLSKKAPPGGISFNADDWRVLTMVNGVRSVTEIAQSISADEAAIARIGRNLLESGVLEVEFEPPAPRSSTVDGWFFEQVTLELARAIGPMAEIIIDDELERLGKKREAFPCECVPDLVENVSSAIRDDAKRIRFQQVMLGSIRKLVISRTGV
jgi:hypothetical protein